MRFFESRMARNRRPRSLSMSKAVVARRADGRGDHIDAALGGIEPAPEEIVFPPGAIEERAGSS